MRGEGFDCAQKKRSGFDRAVRPFLIINFPEPRQIRRAIRNIRNTLPNILNVIVLLFASVAVFSLMAMKLLGT